MPAPCVISPFQTGLRMHCVWIGLSGGSKANGSDPPSGLAYRAGGFPHMSCPKSLREGTRTTLASRRLKLSINYSLSKTFAGKPSLQLCFRTWKHQIIWRFGVENSTSWHPLSTTLGGIQTWPKSDWWCSLCGHRPLDAFSPYSPFCFKQIQKRHN